MTLGPRTCFGAMYAVGLGTPQDYATADAWYSKAAVHGDADAQFNLGLMYRDGRGIARDDAKAASWFLTAGKQGQREPRRRRPGGHEG